MRSFAVLVIASIALGGCGDEQQQSAAGHRASLCTIGTLCDVPQPPPITYEIPAEAVAADGALKSYLRQDLPGADDVTRVGPSTDAGWTDRFGKRHQPIRIYFVPERQRPIHGSIWVIYDHVMGATPRRQVLMRDVDRTKNNIRVDGKDGDTTFVPYRIAIIDRTTEIGPTFVSSYPQKPYERQEYDSLRARAEWESSVTSSCGGGPLSAVPASWVEERNGECAALRKK
jgi:hypothetical protein